MRHRHEASHARHAVREWVVKRRERTRHLIELGGLVVKAGIIDLVEDDRAAIFGALLGIQGTLLGPDREKAILLWRRAGKRAFDTSTRRRSAS